MSHSQNSVRPADLSDLADAIVVQWVSQETPAPAQLSNVLKQYRNLTVYADKASLSEAGKAYDIMNRLYDQLMAAATVKLRISARAEAQLRRIQRRDENRMTWKQKCDRAIEQYYAGVRV